MNHYDDLAAMEVWARTTADRHVVSFSVACLPIPQPRQRHRVIRSGPKAYATNYTPSKHPVNGFKAAIMFEARKWCDRPLPYGPIEIRLRFRFPLPTSAKAADRRAIEAGKMLPYVAKLRNDGDNLEKAAWDALTGILYADDGQICRWSGERVYAKEPGVDVWVAEWRV